MDKRAVINVGVAGLVAALLVAAYIIRRLRLRQTQRQMREFLAEYFNGDLPLGQFVRRARGVASRRFIGSPKCKALVQATFQRSAEAKLADKPHSLEIEKELLTALADRNSDYRTAIAARAGGPAGNNCL